MEIIWLGTDIGCTNTECVPTCMLSYFSHVHFFATLWTVTYQALLFMGFFRQEHQSRLPCPPSGDLPNLGTKLLMSPALTGGFFTIYAPWEAQ